MKTLNFHMLVLIVLITSCKGIEGQKNYTNPILSGFYPDPSICRVQDNYYMVTSTFSFFPGLPIFHSTDLVHWEQIGNALDRPEQLDLDGLGISDGIFAPTLRYHGGTFYIVCTVVGGIENFVITSTNLQNGWSNPVALPHIVGMDPDIFFDDDGKAYISNCAPPENKLYEGHRAIVMHMFDLKTLTTSEEGRVLVNGGTDISKEPIWCEAPHILKRNGYYYMICAEGGTGIEHTEVVFRAKSLNDKFVSYPNNPILTQYHLNMNRKNPVTNTGHADFVQTQNGEWWSVFLGCRPYNEVNDFNTGRETFMLPVKWKNDWPEILIDDEMVGFNLRTPNLRQDKKVTMPLNGNFSYSEKFSENMLPYYFVHIRTPQKPFYTFPENEDGIFMNLLPQTLDEKKAPAFTGRRQQHTLFEMAVKLNFEAKNENEEAGIVAFQNRSRYYLFSRTVDGITVIRGNDGERKTMAKVDVSNRSDVCYLKMKGSSDTYRFFYSFDNKNWEEVLVDGVAEASYLSTNQSWGFIGAILGMYTSSNGLNSDNKAHFAYLDYIGSDEIHSKKN